jgi:hypothetical protein
MVFFCGGLGSNPAHPRIVGAWIDNLTRIDPFHGIGPISRRSLGYWALIRTFACSKFPFYLSLFIFCRAYIPIRTVLQ